jgi:DNA-binding Lrp family transcriptional regulator
MSKIQRVGEPLRYHQPAVGMKRNFRGVWIPKEIWFLENLNVWQKMLLIEIHFLDNEEGCYASNAYFAKFLGRGEASIKSDIRRLEQLGLIERTEFDGRRRTLRSRLIQRIYGVPDELTREESPGNTPQVKAEDAKPDVTPPIEVTAKVQPADSSSLAGRRLNHGLRKEEIKEERKEEEKLSGESEVHKYAVTESVSGSGGNSGDGNSVPTRESAQHDLSTVLVREWNNFAHKYRNVKARHGHANKAQRDYISEELGSVTEDDVKRAIQNCEKSDFMKAQTNKKYARIDFAFFLKHFRDILEGKYVDSQYKQENQLLEKYEESFRSLAENVSGGDIWKVTEFDRKTKLAIANLAEKHGRKEASIILQNAIDCAAYEFDSSEKSKEFWLKTGINYLLQNARKYADKAEDYRQQGLIT